MGRALLVVGIDIDPDHEAELNDWYGQHLASRLQWPGFRSARRYRAVAGGGPRYLAIYELDEPEAALSDDYLRQQPDARGAELARYWELRVRCVYEEIPGEEPWVPRREPEA